MLVVFKELMRLVKSCHRVVPLPVLFCPSSHSMHFLPSGSTYGMRPGGSVDHQASWQASRMAWAASSPSLHAEGFRQVCMAVELGAECHQPC